ncbi:RsbRD N-terminal domain-containing protein [Dethiosulfatarculus sandiegensis]|uniref:RsbT co-antagonist protein RsbRD N-terminal domain-containing protein n=1 Tax=Dethiosulfatarculus sandiegensis TaxID=1429043 RepID=A0A0D2JV75_9BACT|nr:RsbRD N-terminal domain-containing protein [Dethiosulfatarculus sandiegensis]KIX13460.1 hypothetical protein X474_13325 [Dethiosulfatarculus sandiegensis]
MNLQELLKNNRSVICEEWVDCIVNTYPPETAKFLLNKKDRFANPVGHTIVSETQAIFDGLLRGETTEGDIPDFLDRIIRIRALQDFSASESLSFIFELKAVIRSKLQDEIEEEGLEKELFLLEVAIDRLALLGFDIYESCREKVHKAKADEMMNHYANVLRRTGLFYEEPEQLQKEPDVLSKPKPMA